MGFVVVMCSRCCLMVVVCIQVCDKQRPRHELLGWGRVADWLALIGVMRLVTGGHQKTKSIGDK